MARFSWFLPKNTPTGIQVPIGVFFGRNQLNLAMVGDAWHVAQAKSAMEIPHPAEKQPLLSS